MKSLIDILTYLIIIGGAVMIVGSLLCGIHKMVTRIRRVNARLIWRTVLRHRHV